MMNDYKLKEVDKVEVSVVVDNYTDLFLQDSGHVIKRPVIDKHAKLAPVAEHGLSLLITIESQGLIRTILADAGLSEMTLMHNLKVMNINPNTIDMVFLSHGHVDHFGGLTGLLRATDQTLWIVAHPDVFLPRRINVPDDDPVVMPVLDKKALEMEGAVVLEVSCATPLCSGMALSLGEVERLTDFEAGFGWAEVKKQNEWVKDPFRDDQGIVFNVKGKGLVVIGGCSHAGIVNTVHYAKKVTGISDVYAVMGGFHLTGPMFESIIQPTIDAMKEIDPKYVMPMHCTGWAAINRFSQAFPGQFFLTSVGTTYSL